MNARSAQRIVNPLALAGAIVMNALASILPLNGRTTGEISDSFNLVFVPAGYVFSIWGLIYLAVLGFAVFQALPAQQSNPRVAATGWWFVLSCVAKRAVDCLLALWPVSLDAGRHADVAGLVDRHLSPRESFKRRADGG